MGWLTLHLPSRLHMRGFWPDFKSLLYNACELVKVKIYSLWAGNWLHNSATEYADARGSSCRCGISELDYHLTDHLVTWRFSIKWCVQTWSMRRRISCTSSRVGMVLCHLLTSKFEWMAPPDLWPAEVFPLSVLVALLRKNRASLSPWRQLISWYICNFVILFH